MTKTLSLREAFNKTVNGLRAGQSYPRKNIIEKTYARYYGVKLNELRNPSSTEQRFAWEQFADDIDNNLVVAKMVARDHRLERESRGIYAVA